MQSGEPSISLAGRSAIITGGAQGIGLGIAEAFAALGASLTLVDRQGDELAASVARLRDRGAEVVAVVGDVRDAAVVERTVSAAVSAHGRLDVLVNNAGGGFFAPFTDVNERGEAALIAENFTQVTAFVRATVPHLSERGGSIINITSIEGHRAGPGFGIYSAMKAAVENLSRTLALELAPRRIRVNCIAPDMIVTPGDAVLSGDASALDEGFHPSPLGEMGTPADAAGPAVFLASDLSRFVTGSTVHLDGGTLAASGWRRRRGDEAWKL